MDTAVRVRRPSSTAAATSVCDSLDDGVCDVCGNPDRYE